MASARVLVVSGSAGHGHVMAARAVQDALHRRHPTIDTSYIDSLQTMPSWYSRTYKWSYIGLVDKAPLLWRIVYDSTEKRRSPAGSFLTHLAGKRLIKLCERWQPQVVLCTHILAPEVLGRAMRKGRVSTSLQLVVTDYDIHRMWYWPQVSRYYVASDLVKARLCLRFGVAPERVMVTGIPVRREFGMRHDTIAVRARYGLDPSRPVVLFLSGGFASGPMRQAIVGIWRERPDAQILAVCGRNQRLRRRVQRLSRPAGASLNALGFVEKPAELMAVSDLVVAKSGGSTVAECLAAGKPLIISASIPGQEERNAEALIEAGAGVRAPTPEEIRWRVARLLEDPRKLRAMAKAARAFAKPRAALDIADAVASDLEEPFLAGPRFHGAS